MHTHTHTVQSSWSTALKEDMKEARIADCTTTAGRRRRMGMCGVGDAGDAGEGQRERIEDMHTHTHTVQSS